MLLKNRCQHCLVQLSFGEEANLQQAHGNKVARYLARPLPKGSLARSALSLSLSCPLQLHHQCKNNEPWLEQVVTITAIRAHPAMTSSHRVDVEEEARPAYQKFIRIYKMLTDELVMLW